MSFRMGHMQGSAARNKGHGVVPRAGSTADLQMIARQDNENIYLIYSDDLHRWDGGKAIMKPQFIIFLSPPFPLGNSCRSETAVPIEWDEGWLVLNARSRSGPKIFDRRGLARQERSIQGAARSVEHAHPEASEREATFPMWSIPAER